MNKIIYSRYTLYQRTSIWAQYAYTRVRLP